LVDYKNIRGYTAPDTYSTRIVFIRAYIGTYEPLALPMVSGCYLLLYLKLPFPSRCGKFRKKPEFRSLKPDAMSSM
jgi:hypothetical protein